MSWEGHTHTQTLLTVLLECIMHIFRWSKLKAALVAKRSKLGESQSLQQFNRDADEVETWMMEKMQTASDESYKDPTNLQVYILYYFVLGTLFHFMYSGQATKTPDI